MKGGPMIPAGPIQDLMREYVDANDETWEWLAASVGVQPRSIQRVMSQESITFDLADRLVTYSFGPMRWYEDDELKKIYLEADLSESLEHGTRQTYVNHRCRCKACVAANTEYMREHKGAEPFKPAQHGTRTMYENHKCRCEPCTKFVSDYYKAYREKNADRINARQRAQREKNADHINALRRERRKMKKEAA